MKKNKKSDKTAERLAALTDLATGYQKSKILFTFGNLGIADLLNEKPLGAEAVARKLKIETIAAERFLNACTMLGLLKKSGKTYSNSTLSKEFLIKDGEFYLGGQLERYGERSYPLWENLEKSLKKWKAGATSQSVPEDEDQGAEAMAEQHNYSYLHGTHLARAFDFSKYKKLLDLGGGTGAMSIGLCRAFPKLEAVVFDLEQNVKIAEKFVKKAGLSKQIKCVGGDFQKDGLPEDFDAVLLANFMSVADEKDNLKLLADIYDKLPKGGACIISGLIMDNSKLAPETAVLFCLEDICQNAPDVERSEKIYTDWLKKTGFVKIKCETYLAPTKMLCGFKK